MDQMTHTVMGKLCAIYFKLLISLCKIPYFIFIHFLFYNVLSMIYRVDECKMSNIKPWPLEGMGGD